MSGTYGNTTWANIPWFYATGSGEVTHADLFDFAQYAISAWSGLVQPMHENVTLERCDATLYESTEGDIIATATGAYPGTTETGAQAANVAACVSWLLAHSYRGGHPRSYLPGVIEANLADFSSFTGEFTDELNGHAADVHASLEGYPGGGGIETIEHGVVSFQTAGDWRTPPIFKRIVGSAVDTRVDTQRRRLGPDR